MFFKLILFFLCIPSISISAKTELSAKDLMGVWKVQSVSLIDSNLSSRSTITKEYYESAEFHLKGNSMYAFNYGSNTPDQIKRTNKSYNNWIFSDQTIKIGHILNGYASKRIKVKIEENLVYFLISNFKLEVKRISKEEPEETKRSNFVNAWLKFLTVSDDGHLNRSIDESNTYTIYEIDRLPLYKGCKSKWDKEKQIQCLSLHLSNFINTSLDTRKIAKESNLLGEVVKFEVNFVLDKNGKPANIHVLGGTDFAIKEVLKTIEKLKDAKPAVKDSEAVNVAINLPVSFVVQK